MPAWPGPGGDCGGDLMKLPSSGALRVKEMLHLSWDFSAQERTICFSSMYSKVKSIHRNSPYCSTFFSFSSTFTVFKKSPRNLILPLVNSITVKSLKICFVPANKHHFAFTAVGNVSQVFGCFVFFLFFS